MSRTKTEYIQTVLIQEPLEQAVNNSPVIFTAKIYGSHIGKVFVGQKKRVTGIFKSIVTKDDENDIVIQLISMEDLDLCDTILPSDTELQDYRKELSSDETKFIKKLVDSFAPEIYADDLYKDIKLSILLQLVGGKNKKERRHKPVTSRRPKHGKVRTSQSIKTTYTKISIHIRQRSLSSWTNDRHSGITKRSQGCTGRGNGIVFWRSRYDRRVR